LNRGLLFRTLVNILELSKKHVQKRKLRANFFKIETTTSQGAKESFVVVLKQF
jgi:hypothetical protein